MRPPWPPDRPPPRARKQTQCSSALRQQAMRSVEHVSRTSPAGTSTSRGRDRSCRRYATPTSDRAMPDCGAARDSVGARGSCWRTGVGVSAVLAGRSLEAFRPSVVGISEHMSTTHAWPQRRNECTRKRSKQVWSSSCAPFLPCVDTDSTTPGPVAGEARVLQTVQAPTPQVMYTVMLSPVRRNDIVSIATRMPC